MQNKKFYIKYETYDVSEILTTLNITFILYYLLHMKMKKMLFGTLLWMFTLAWVAVLPNYASAETTTGERDKPTANTNLVNWSQTLAWSHLLTTIKNAINWILWILATIALIICLYGGFLMITSAGDEKKYWDWLKVLKNAAIGLAIIWLSWMIVSIVFWFIGTLWGKDATTQAGGQGWQDAGSRAFEGDETVSPD